jgi:hypothetical protein
MQSEEGASYRRSEDRLPILVLLPCVAVATAPAIVWSMK